MKGFLFGGFLFEFGVSCKAWSKFERHVRFFEERSFNEAAENWQSQIFG